MSWLLKHRKKDNKWRIYTTISEGWISDWLSESEVKAQLADEYRRDYKLRLIETYWTFPDGWSNKDTRKVYFNQKAKKEFLEWNLEILRNPETYYEEIDKKFKELKENI